MRQRFDPTTLYSPQRARSVWLGRDLMRKIQDRLLTTERPDPAIKDPIELRPVLSLTCDIDAMVQEPNYEAISIAYTAAAGNKKLWTVPDDEICISPAFSYIRSNDAGRTFVSVELAEDDTLARSCLLYNFAAGNTVHWGPSLDLWRPLVCYPGETFHVYYDVNVAGGTMTAELRYTRLKTTEVPL